jgi:hypothetical protein
MSESAVEDQTITREREAFLEHVRVMIGYWASEGGSNVPEETPKREALSGLAFSILVMLDGGAVDVGPYAVRAVADDGSEGGDIAGPLHELLG